VASNYLEELIAQWYEFQGYFLRRNVLVGRRARGGYECELDIVGFHPVRKHLVHIEPSMDAAAWAMRERRFANKFGAGRRYIPGLFAGFDLPDTIEQIAVLAFASVRSRSIGGGRVQHISDLLEEIFKALRGRRIASSAIPEHLSILRSFQFVAEYHKSVSRGLGDP
jgi:hypothetical protein